jgi:quinoprotein glucose dehydrogenase
MLNTTRIGAGANFVLIVVMGLIGIALGAGGVWLIVVGGSWFYLVAGLAFLATALLLWKRRPAALAFYGVFVVGTLVWAVWEAGLDWWALAARGDLVFVIGVLLLLPFVTRRLHGRAERGATTAPPARASAVRGPGLLLIGALSLALVVAVASWFVDVHATEGALADSRLAAAEPAAATAAASPTAKPEVPPGEWHAYGRTGWGQRYSPLDQITPENVDQLEVAWHYHTEDESQPGDPVETTFEVTPLKIGDLLYLCTPHQNVVAIDATTGEEVWRHDPEIRGELALQHLTCRGLSYQPPSPAGATEAAGAAPTGTAAAAGNAGGEEADGAGENAPVGTASDLSGSGGLTAPQTDDQPGTPDGEGAGSPGPGDEAADLPVAAATAELTSDTCNGKLFMPTADGRLIALDLATGAVCTSFGRGTGQIDLWRNMPKVNPGSYYSTSPVVVTENLVIVGGTVLDNVSTNEASGVIRAFDVDTGDLVWAFDTGNPDLTAPLPPGQTYTANSPNSWSISAVDEELGMVYVPLGNQPPDQWGADRSEDVERFSSSVIALNLEDGSLAWVFQTVHHDLWDYDVPAQPSLINLTIDGADVPALVQPTKQGELYVLNRATGEPVLPVTEAPAPQGAVEPDYTAPTQPVSALSFDPKPLEGRDMWGATLLDQMACRIAFHRYHYDGRYTPPTLEGTLVYPGNFGVFNWGGIAVDPVRQIAFTTPAYLAFVSRLVPRSNTEELVVNEQQPEGALPALNENFGAPYAVELSPFTSFVGIPCQAPPWGYVAGADLTTGEIVWMHKNGTVRDLSPLPLPFKMGVPDLGGPVMTAGGVAFISGTLDYYVRGYDVATGEQLWENRLPAGGQSTPMSYQGRDGRQYLVVSAGGHGSLGTKRGDSVIAYALPQE